MEMLSAALRGIGNPNTWVIASAGALEYAQQGLFAEAFCNALRRPATGPSQRFVSLDSIVQAVNDANVGQAQQQARLFPPATGSTGIPPFFPNPSHQSGLAGLTVADQHWLSRVRGGPEESTTGFYLAGKTGRIRAAEHLAAWMNDPGSKGLAVVTGSPGTGKSALLALPVLLSEGSRREDLLRAAETGSVIQCTADLLPGSTSVIAIHARGLNADQVAGMIAQALGRGSATASALLEDLDAIPEHNRRVVIIDGVDEATSPAILLLGLLLPLARQPGLQVAVGSRRHVLSGVGDADLTIDLDAEEYHDPQALIDYVYRLLTASEEPSVTSPYKPGSALMPGERSEAAAAVAAAIAQRATAREGTSESFLIGRLLALSVRGRHKQADISRQGWQSELPISVANAFDEDLARLGNKAPVARALLRALAWANGPGLPWENIWVPAARTLAEDSDGADHPPITDEDVRWLLDKAGAYVVEDLGPGGRSVYRPFHDLLAVHLRGEPNTEQEDGGPVANEAWRLRRVRTEQGLTDALLATVPVAMHVRDWRSAHPYLRTYLAQHAAAARPGTLPTLVQDADFLAAADPITLSPLLSLTVPELRDVARIYRRARPLLGEEVGANAAYLQEAARALSNTAAEGAGIRPVYRTHLASVRRDDSILTLTGFTGWVNSVAFGTAPDGRLLLASSSDDKTVRVWDPVAGTLASEPLNGHTAWVNSVAFGTAPDGRLLLASSSDDKTVRVWDPVAGTPATDPLSGHTVWVISVAFGAGPDGRLLLASGSGDQTVRLWDPATGTLVGEPLTGHTRQVHSVAFGTAPDGRLLLASGSRDQTVRLWDPATGTLVGEPLTGHTRQVHSVAFGTAPDGRLLLASGSLDGTVRLWDPATGTPVGEPLTGHVGQVHSVAFGTAPDGRLLLASGSRDQTVRLWDPATGTPVGEPLTGHTGWVTSVAFGTGPGGRLLLASGGTDQTVRVWDPLADAPASPHTGHSGSVTSVAFGTGPGGRLLLASGSRDQTVRLWNAVTGRPVGEPLTGHASQVHSVAFGTGPGGRLLLASGSRDQTVRLWNAVTGRPVGEPLTGHASQVHSITFGTGPGGRLLLASGSADRTVRLWDWVTGVPIGKPLTSHTGSVTSVAFGTSLDGRLLLASGSRDQTVRLWDPATGTPASSLTGHMGSVTSVAFGTGPGGRLLLASGSRDQTVRLWDPVTGTLACEPFVGHMGPVTSVAFIVGLDGRLLLVSGSYDQTVRVWEPLTGACVVTLQRRSRVRSIAAASLELAILDDEGICVIEFDGRTAPMTDIWPAVAAGVG